MQTVDLYGLPSEVRLRRTKEGPWSTVYGLPPTFPHLSTCFPPAFHHLSTSGIHRKRLKEKDLRANLFT